MGRGFLFGSTWYLVPRTIPFMEESQQRFGKIARVEGLKISDDFIKGKGALTIPANKKVTILIDQEHHTIGHPEIPNAPKDASAAAITASAMLELAGFIPEKKEILIAYATDILRELSSDKYLAKEGENGGFILKHSVGNIHEDNETDTAINYADYYYLEALIRWRNIK